jgi:bifunctional DNase/RNase
MLTTSQNPDDAERANKHHVHVDYRTKPLTHEMLVDIITRYSEPVAR